MKTKHKIVLTAVATSLAFLCQAGAQDSLAPRDSYFLAQELSIDMFGTGSIRQQTLDHFSGDRVRESGRLGAGLGANYYFTRYVGIGGDLYTENTQHSLVDSTSGNLLLRYPFDAINLAPYLFGGGGYKFDIVSQDFAQVGVGLDFRFTRHIGIFVDARHVFAERTRNYDVGRLGIRIIL